VLVAGCRLSRIYCGARAGEEYTRARAPATGRHISTERDCVSQIRRSGTAAPPAGRGRGGGEQTEKGARNVYG